MNICRTCKWIGEDQFLRPGGACGSCGASDVRKVTQADLAYTTQLPPSTVMEFDIEKSELVVLTDPTWCKNGTKHPDQASASSCDGSCGVDIRELIKKLTSHPGKP